MDKIIESITAAYRATELAPQFPRALLRHWSWARRLIPLLPVDRVARRAKAAEQPNAAKKVQRRPDLRLLEVLRHRWIPMHLLRRRFA